MLKVALNKLKKIAKMRGVKGYKSMPEELLAGSLYESDSVKEVKRILMVQE